VIEIRVGMNKLLAILSFAVAGINLFTFALTAKLMHGGIAGLFVLLGVLQLFATAFVVAIAGDGSGEVQLKNPLGMTLRRHPFAKLSDLQVDGSKLYVTRTDGHRKKLGGFGADGGDMARLRARLDELSYKTPR
jgi:hypothetical protein